MKSRNTISKKTVSGKLSTTLEVNNRLLCSGFIYPYIVSSIFLIPSRSFNPDTAITSLHGIVCITYNNI